MIETAANFHPLLAVFASAAKTGLSAYLAQPLKTTRG